MSDRPSKVRSIARAILHGGRRRFEYWGEPLDDAAYASLGSGAWRCDALAVEPGVVLRGIVRDARADGAPWVLFFPGNSSAFLREARSFLDAVIGDRPWGGAAWAYRGFDGSPGVPGPEALARDARRAFDDVAKRAAAKCVHVAGFSLGAHLAAAVAAGAASDPKLASLTLLAPPSAIEIGHASLAGRLRPPDRYDTMAYLDAITAATLVIHGTRDDALPVDMGRAVAARLAARARFVEVPSAAHLDLCAMPEVVEAVRGAIAGGEGGGATPG